MRALRLVAVYALIDPRDNTTRYIGRTFNLAARTRSHVPHAGENKAKRAWLANLWAAGLRRRGRAHGWSVRPPPVRPRVVVLEWCRDVVTAEPITNGKGKRGHVGATGARRTEHMMRSAYFSVRQLAQQTGASAP